MSVIAGGPGCGYDEKPAKLPLDPWRHRSLQMRCRTCMWYAVKTGGANLLGRCRKHAPTMGGYPAVFNSDWCGDHKLDEKKV